jgi:succinate dehydrogenase/fumarate reductase flavoprotein subunit
MSCLDQICINIYYVATTDALPPIWHIMASQGHKQDRWNLQYALNQLEIQLGPSGMGGDPINVSGQLGTNLGGLQFLGDATDSLGGGTQPGTNSQSLLSTRGAAGAPGSITEAHAHLEGHPNGHLGSSRGAQS